MKRSGHLALASNTSCVLFGTYCIRQTYADRIENHRFFVRARSSEELCSYPEVIQFQKGFAMTRFVKCQLGLTLALSITAAGNAQAPTFDPREWKGSLAGAPTQVLTLGSTHLSQLSTKVDDALLASLLAKLAAYRPDFITAEGLSLIHISEPTRP